ncbi:MAG: hypothetical protein ACKOXO_04995 [Cyanobium sp.]
MSSFGSADVPSDLEGIRAAIAAANPDLYRHLALYLQVLRHVLPERVHQACFHLATQVHASRYLRLSRRERLALHRHRHALLRRCCSLLTVEQLEALARQMVREQQQHQSEREQQLLARLLREARRSDSAEDDGAGNGVSEASLTTRELPPGSVRLDLAPPLQGGALHWSELTGAFQAAAAMAADDELDGDDLDGDALEPDDEEEDRPSSRDRAEAADADERRRFEALNGEDQDDEEAQEYRDTQDFDAAPQSSRWDGADRAPGGGHGAAGGAQFRQADDRNAPDQPGLESGGRPRQGRFPEFGSDRSASRQGEAEPPGPQAEPGRTESSAAADAEIAAIFAAAAAAASGMGRRPPPRRRASLQMAPDSDLSDADEGEDGKGDEGNDDASLDAEDFLQAASTASRRRSPEELAAAEEEPAALPPPWDRTGLPDDPLLLLEWLEGLEKALARRLRNLSHAINVDLLRFGMSRGLLPLNLLDAVLQGQIETMASPANVLRLQLPFGLRPGAPPLQAVSILLRQADLEMEEPRLRTCRRRWQQHRQEVRRMAQQYRRLQRRQQAHDAERLWLQDIRSSLPPQS